VSSLRVRSTLSMANRRWWAGGFSASAAAHLILELTTSHHSEDRIACSSANVRAIFLKGSPYCGEELPSEQHGEVQKRGRHASAKCEPAVDGGR
jgi:hypothetical protein